MNRFGEMGDMPERNKRFFQRSGYWYYATREGIDIGPFDSVHEAEAGASAFIDFILHAEPDVRRSLDTYRREATAA